MFPFLLALASPALACSFVGPEPFEIVEDGQLADPAPAKVEVVSIRRGVGPERAGCGSMMSTSCDDLGWIELSFEPRNDEIGYLLLPVGDAPVTGYDEPVQDGPGNTITLVWIDGATDEQEPLDFELEVIAVNRAGNESEPVFLEITDPGSGAGAGCSTTPGSLVAGLVVLVAFRRRTRSVR